ncbi:MAG: aldose epimerase family protein [Fidelibacterota bacterium]
MKYTKSIFGQLANGTTIYKYRLENDNKMIVELMTYGATVTSIQLNSKELTLGFDTLEEWIANPIFAGATVGRYANRIANGRFDIDGKTYHLSKNEAPKTLHGGIQGFDKVVWGAKVSAEKDCISINFFRISPDGEQGFPGNLDVHVIYTLTNENELQIDYKTTTDAPTHVNLSHHSYFNLSQKKTIKNHQVSINADHFTPVTDGSIPTGKIEPVAGTEMDLNKLKYLKTAINSTGGFDHNFVLKNEESINQAARVFAPDTGIQMDVLTTLPGIQFYTGKYIDNLKGRKGKIYPPFAGLALEPQYFPDTPNQPEFPSTLLRPGNRYEEKIIYRFSKK